MGAVSIAELVAKIRTAKVSSGTTGGVSTKVCTSESFPLYGMRHPLIGTKVSGCSPI